MLLEGLFLRSAHSLEIGVRGGRAHLKCLPSAALSPREYSALTEHLHAEDRRGLIERDQVDGPPKGVREILRQVEAVDLIEIAAEQADIDIARVGRAAGRERSEENDRPGAASILNGRY